LSTADLMTTSAEKTESPCQPPPSSR
jgi:hypothetical protein